MFKNIVGRLRRVHVTMLNRLIATSVAGVLAGATLAGAVMTNGCSADQKRVERGVLDMGTGDCVIIRGVISNDTLDSICAKEQELAPLVKDLFMARRRAAAKSGKVGVENAQHPDDLPPAPGSNVCELAQAAGCSCATASTP